MPSKKKDPLKQLEELMTEQKAVQAKLGALGVLPTKTPLDGWLGGGIPLEGLTLVMGPQGSGKTALLRAIAAERATPETPTAYISRDENFAGGFRLDNLDEVVDVVNHLHSMDPKPVILIDDAQAYAASGNGPGARTKDWASMVRNPLVREHPVVVASQVRRVEAGTSTITQGGLGRGPTYAADIILTTEVQASIHNGIVLRLTCLKNRWLDTDKMDPFLMAVVRDEERGWRGEAA